MNGQLQTLKNCEGIDYFEVYWRLINENSVMLPASSVFAVAKKKFKTGQTVTVTENNKIYLSAYQKQQPLSKAVVELVNFWILQSK